MLYKFGLKNRSFLLPLHPTSGPLRATAIELTASGMDVAAARKVKPEMIVGISEKSLGFQWLNDFGRVSRKVDFKNVSLGCLIHIHSRLDVFMFTLTPKQIKSRNAWFSSVWYFKARTPITEATSEKKGHVIKR